MAKRPPNYFNRIVTSSVFCSMSAHVLLLIAVLFAAGLLHSGFKAEATPIAAQDDAQTDDLFIRLVDKGLGTDWYGIYVQGNKVGHGKLTISRDKGPEGTIYRIMLSGTLKTQSRGQITKMKVGYDARFYAQSPYGLQLCSTNMKSNGDISEITIVKTPNGYQAKIVQGNETRTQIIGPLDYTLKHELAVETWIQKRPKVGKSIEYPVLNFDTLEMENMTSRIKAIRHAIVDGVKIKYYEIATTDAEGLEIVALYGADGTAYTIAVGGLIKFQLEPKALAIKLDKPIDLFVHNMVIINQALGKSDKVTRLQLAIDDISGALISDAPGQTVKRDEADERYIVTLNPNGDHRIKATDEEIKKNLRATTDVPINHPKVIALAQKALANVKTTTQKVAHLVKFVDEYIEDVYMADPLSVLDIIAKQKGDCNVHAELFTAMARSQGIPCRKVGGLLYLGDEFKAFGQHAWNEVVIDGVWVPVDSSWGQTTIDATHLRFPVNISEECQIIALIPKMKISVLDVEFRN